MNTIVNYGITALFIIVFFGLTIYEYNTFWVKVKKRQNDLQKIQKILDNAIPALNDGISVNMQTYTEIDKAFSNNDVFETTWQQYRKNMITMPGEEERKRITVEAENYFTVSVLLSGLKNDFWKNLAGIFTGLGILGTFAGLTFGVVGIDTQSMNGLQQGISQLLNGTSTAFITSIVGIFAAMIFNWFYSGLMKNVHADVDKLCSALDEIFPLITMENLLVMQLEESQEQGATLKTLSGDLGDIMGETLMNVQAALEQSIDTNFKPLFDELLTTMKALNNGGMSAIADSLNEGAGKEIASFAKTLTGMEQGMKEIMEQARIANEASMNQLRQSIEELTDKMNATISSSVTANSEGAAKNQEILTQLMEDISTKMTGIVSDISKASNQSNAEFADMMKNAANQVQVMVDAMQQGMTSQTTSLQEEMAKFMKQASHTSAEHMENLQQSMDKLTAKMKNTVEESTEANARETASNQKQIQQLLETVQAQMTDTVQAITTVSQESSQHVAHTMKEAAATVENLTLAMKQELEELTGTMQASQGLITQAGRTADKFTDAAKPMQQAAQDVSGRLTQVIDATTAFNQHVGNSAALVNTSVEKQTATISSIQTAIQQMEIAWKAYETNFGNVNKALQETFTILLTNTKDYTNTVNDGLRDNLKAFDEGVRNTGGALNTINEDLVAAVEDLTEVIKELKRNLKVNGQYTQRR